MLLSLSVDRTKKVLCGFVLWMLLRLCPFSWY